MQTLERIDLSEARIHPIGTTRVTLDESIPAWDFLSDEEPTEDARARVTWLRERLVSVKLPSVAQDYHLFVMRRSMEQPDRLDLLPVVLPERMGERSGRRDALVAGWLETMVRYLRVKERGNAL